MLSKILLATLLIAVNATPVKRADGSASLWHTVDCKEVDGPAQTISGYDYHRIGLNQGALNVHVDSGCAFVYSVPCEDTVGVEAVQVPAGTCAGTPYPNYIQCVRLAESCDQPAKVKRQGNTAVNLGEGSCAAPTGTRGPVEGFGACSDISDDGCCTVYPGYTGGTYAWVSMLTNGHHGHIQAFSDAHCAEDASPIVSWDRGACVDANNSGKDIGSIRLTD